MKILIIILPLLITEALFGQNSVDTILVLDLHQKTNYIEGNNFWRDNGIILYQKVAFDNPKIVDDEYSHILSIKILESAIIAGQKSFDLPNDSMILTCTYDRTWLWYLSKRVTRTIGHLKIISLKKDIIEAELDLTITDQMKTVYVYHGKRMFKRAKPVAEELILAD